MATRPGTRLTNRVNTRRLAVAAEPRGLYSGLMCMNCISNAEAQVAQAALFAAVMKAPAHRLLAAAGLVEAPDPVRRDARSVAFLRALDLDPSEILGHQVVARADRWAAQPSTARVRSRRPIGSQSRLALQ